MNIQDLNSNERVPLFVSRHLNPSNDRLLVPWNPGPLLGDLSFPWMASCVFPSLEIPKKTRGMLIFLSCFMAGEPHLRRRPGY